MEGFRPVFPTDSAELEGWQRLDYWMADVLETPLWPSSGLVARCKIADC